MPRIDPNGSGIQRPVRRVQPKKRVVVPPSPAAADVNRTPQQKRRDQAAVKRNIGQAKTAIRQRQISTSGDRGGTRVADAGRAESYVAGLYKNAPKATTVRVPGEKRYEPIKVPGYRPGTTVPPDVAATEALRRQHQQTAKAAATAPALVLLNQLTRPIHALANETLSDVKRGGVKELFAIHAPGSKAAADRRRALSSGFSNKDKTLFSDVLKQLGIHGAAASILGFGLDTGLDPTTYVSFGEGSLARQGLEHAAEKTGAAKLSEAARGSLPGRLARHVNPNIRPAGVSKEDFAAVRDALRRGRAVTAVGERHGRNVAQAIARKLPGHSHPQITDALEAAGVSAPEHTIYHVGGRRFETEGAAHAHAVQAALRIVEKDAGSLRGGTHDLEAELGRVTRQQARKPIGRSETQLDRIRRRRSEAKAALSAEPASILHDYRAALESGDKAQVAYAEERALKWAQEHAPHHGAAVPKVEQTTEGGSHPGEAALADLSPHEQLVVSVLAHEYDRIHATEHSKGLVGSKLPEFGYSPRRHRSELEPAGSLKGRKLSGAQLASSKTRTNRQMYKDFRGTEHDVYTENAPLSYYLRARDSAIKQGRHEVITALHGVGKVWHPGVELKAGEEIYKFAPRKMPTLVEGDELKSLMHGGAPAGRNEYRVLHRDLVGTAEQAVPHRVEGLEELGRIWDRQVQGKVKTILTVPNPQYHLTNLYGDLFNAYLGSPVTELAHNFGISAKALVYKARREAAAKTLGKQVSASGTVKIGGQTVGYDELIKEAETHGAIGQGFIGRDLAQVLDAQGKEAREKVGQGRLTKRLGEPGRKIATSRVGSKVLHPLDTIRDLSQYREDSVRLATYLGARKRGLEPDAAAKFTAKHHFDYGDLTQFEKSVARRVMPFYTFTARNTPLQARTLFERPGKFANLEKVREEALKASGVPQGYEDNLQHYEQQGLPIPIPGTKNLLYPKLPATDLGRLTVKDQANYLMAMLTPLIKSPVELTQNYSFFLRKPIDELASVDPPKGQPSLATLKPAPPAIVWALKHSPGGKAIAKTLHMEPYTDKKTGKRVIGWPARLDYVWRQTPETNLASQAASQIPNTRGQSSKQVAIGYLTGLKTVPYSEPDVAQQQAGKAYDYGQAKAKKMRHDGSAYDSGGRPTPAYRKVLDATRAAAKALGITGGGRFAPSSASSAAPVAPSISSDPWDHVQATPTPVAVGSSDPWDLVK